MIAKPNCYTRRCKHFIGVKSDGLEVNERVYCEAYLDMIPDRIAYGEDLHLVVADDQENDVVFEKGND